MQKEVLNEKPLSFNAVGTDVSNYAPAVSCLKFGRDGQPWLAGSRCRACKAVFPGERHTCAACLGRDTIEPVRLAERGELYSYTIVHRSYPGITTPFISAIVDLQGGGSLRGTLLGIEPEPEKLVGYIPIEVVFRETSQVSREGKRFIAYYFVPARSAS